MRSKNPLLQDTYNPYVTEVLELLKNRYAQKQAELKALANETEYAVETDQLPTTREGFITVLENVVASASCDMLGRVLEDLDTLLAEYK